jgi:hypothetical protein
VVQALVRQSFLQLNALRDQDLRQSAPKTLFRRQS